MFKARKPLQLFLILLSTGILSACTAGGAAVTGAQMVYDRHAFQKKLNDHYTTMQAYRSIYLDTNQYKNSHVTVSTFNDSLLVAGQVPSLQYKKEIHQLVEDIAEGRTVYNYLEIGKPISYLTRASDSWITSKIKAQFIAVNDADLSNVKVVTENGTVFLIGTLPKNDANIALTIAKETTGVQNIIKLFSYVHITKT